MLEKLDRVMPDVIYLGLITVSVAILIAGLWVFLSNVVPAVKF